jgi:hypothetical protein
MGFLQGIKSLVHAPVRGKLADMIVLGTAPPKGECDVVSEE